MNMTIKSGLIVCAIAVMSGCGGGGDGVNNTPTVNTATDKLQKQSFKLVFMDGLLKMLN